MGVQSSVQSRNVFCCVLLLLALFPPAPFGISRHKMMLTLTSLAIIIPHTSAFLVPSFSLVRAPSSAPTFALYSTPEEARRQAESEDSEWYQQFMAEMGDVVADSPTTASAVGDKREYFDDDDFTFDEDDELLEDEVLDEPALRSPSRRPRTKATAAPSRRRERRAAPPPPPRPLRNPEKIGGGGENLHVCKELRPTQ